ncbi:mechanosensitive ion channel family protein [[Limnothrix rosea] IAM M-220]|uniref:mechanosensitive ion channel family protein n=1 Tax=[Limnothrix rosea] IAM M-220 TaxID=454133 RepID=UPI00095DF8D0|nr:mechanosensitive ion channel family protein [[Limnothrix rosea] IAM M-220]OKH15926.1 mechanosensitive ion channel family protein [[Limnothrix rosea] IAM M-220]
MADFLDYLQPLGIDILTLIVQIVVFLAIIFIIRCVVLNTLERLSQWFHPRSEFNPLGITKVVFQKGLSIIVFVGIGFVFIVNVYLLYTGESVFLYMKELVSGVPRDQWQSFGIGIIKSILLLLLTALIVASLRPWSRRLGDRLKSWQENEANADSIKKFLWATELSLETGLWLLALVLCLEFLFLPEAVISYFYFALECYLLVCFGAICVYGIFALIDTLDVSADDFILDHPKSLFRFYPRFRYLIGLTKRCFEYAVYVAIAGLICVQLPWVKPLAIYAVTINQIIAIILATGISIELANITIEGFLLRARNLDPFQRRRRLTFVPLIQNTVRYLIYFGSGVAVLHIFNIDPTPVLAGAGIVGLAVGLGAQNLINDLVNGFTILLQNYYLVGDFVETDTAAGVVEAMDLRVTRFRSPEGRLHIVRNGDIKTIVNYSKEYVYAVVHVGVDYDSNLDHVYGVLEDVGKQVKELHPDVLEPTCIDGLDNFSESELTIRTSTKVKPGKHLPVQRLVRKLIKEAFDRENVEIPFARRVLILKNQTTEDQANIKKLTDELED